MWKTLIIIENKNSFTYQPVNNGKIKNNQIDSGIYIFLNHNLDREEDSERQYNNDKGENINFTVEIVLEFSVIDDSTIKKLDFLKTKSRWRIYLNNL